MFNGIIYNTGIVTRIAKLKNSLEITLKTKMKFNKYEIGSSVCCNGTCLTLTKVNKNLITFYLSRETLNKTNFKYIKNKHLINLEKSLSYGTKVSGHYVQGHTDTTAKIINIEVVDKTWIIKLVVNKIFAKYLIEKGSISLNGVSLTISKVKKNKFEINVIPHTLKLTNLINMKKNNFVNIELDIFSKYLINLKN
jgi:riboflavin synthase|tara:strand:+ start:1141 stop:1725 length:585 start_codon:yes stop_codon:yes gene_type:complete